MIGGCGSSSDASLHVVGMGVNRIGMDQGSARGGDLAGLNWRFLPIEAASWPGTGGDRGGGRNIYPLTYAVLMVPFVFNSLERFCNFVTAL